MLKSATFNSHLKGMPPTLVALKGMPPTLVALKGMPPTLVALKKIHNYT